MQRRKKIGVITHPTISNYGGILQAYALQNTLVKMGFDAEVIEKRLYPRQLSFVEKLFVYPYRLLKKYVFHKKCPIKREHNLYNYAYNRWLDASKNTIQFVNRNIRHNYIFDFEELKKDDYYALIVGSDQIWRPKYLINIQIGNAFLDFAKDWNVKRISYAASFGSEQWEYEEENTKTCRELLKRFNAVSCREYKGEFFCKSYLGYPTATTVLDPTMLLDEKDYLSLCEGQKFEDDSGIMCYVLDKDERSEQIVGYIQEQLGCNMFEVRAKSTSINASFEEKVQPPVERWILGFKNADFVITDSFHACVFSILFQKPFILLVNHDRGAARYATLLDYFDLSYRMIEYFDEKKIEDILSRPLVVNQSILAEKREQAMSFLKNGLGVNM